MWPLGFYGEYFRSVYGITIPEFFQRKGIERPRDGHEIVSIF